MLVATDVASRGIDVESLSHVINFDLPTVPEDYIHRVGRTGRAAATGDAFSLVAPAEEDDLRRIERVVGEKIPRVRLEGFAYGATPDEPLETPRRGRGGSGRGRNGQGRKRSAGRNGGQESGTGSDDGDGRGGPRRRRYGRRRG